MSTDLQIGQRVRHRVKKHLIGTITIDNPEPGTVGVVAWDDGNQYVFDSGTYLDILSLVEELAHVSTK